MNSALNNSSQRESLRPGNEVSLPSLIHSTSTDQHGPDQDTKPFKMNTYIQLDIDENNFNCLPRICKFVITKLKLDQEFIQPTVILAVKLEASKRSLRTLEIPLQNQKADLNLLYNITYPHYLKKDTNILYIYVQTRRKKYKTKAKTIQFGYKTLAYTFIDLAKALQKPYSNELPLYLRSTKNGPKQQIIGYLSIQALTSQPINDYDTSEDIEYDLNSDVDSDTEQKKTAHAKNNKNQLTGKIISFIRKLKNENGNQHKSTQSTDQTIENEHSLIINHVYDLDYDENEDLDDEFYKNIEQVSDYANSDSDEPNFLFKDQDAYSIVSTPKPKIEPFYSHQNVDDSDQQSLCLNFKQNYLITDKPESIMDNYVVRKNFTIVETDELGKSLNEQQLEYLLKNKTNIKIFLIASANSTLTNYLRSFYLNIVRLNSDYGKIFQNFFILSTDKQEILNFLIFYLNEENVKMSLSQMQIGEVMLHSDNESLNGKLVPFLNSVSINQNDDEPVNCAKMAGLSTSSSLPQFLNLNVHNSQSKLSKCNYSPPNSPLTNQENVDISSFYNLQIDYWTNASQDNTNNQEHDPNKSNLKALFKSVIIFRNHGPGWSDPAQYLTLSYCIKEKKQKSKQNTKTVVIFLKLNYKKISL